MKMTKMQLIFLSIAFLEIIYANEENKTPTTPATPLEVQELLDAWKQIDDVKSLHGKVDELIWQRYKLQQEIGQLKAKNHELENKLKAKEIVHDENVRLNKRIGELEQKNQETENQLTNRKLIKETTEEIWDAEEIKDFMEKSKAIQRAIKSVEQHEKLLLAISAPDYYEMWQAVEKLIKVEALETILDLNSPSVLSQSSRKKILYHYIRWRYGMNFAKTSPKHIQSLRTTMKQMNLTEHEFCLGLSNLFVNVQAFPQIYFSPNFRPPPENTLKAIAISGLDETFSDEPISFRAIQTLLLVQKQEHHELMERLARTKPTMETLPDKEIIPMT